MRFSKLVKIIILSALTSVLPSKESLIAKALITKESIEKQKKLLTVEKLKNGIPIVIYEAPNSDIVSVRANFTYGSSSAENGKSVASELLLDTMAMDADSWPKARLNQTLERYSSSIGCEIYIEYSSCAMSTTNAYWEDILEPFAAVIKNPSLKKEDLNLTVIQKKAQLQALKQNPDSAVNELVNTIFYGSKHPYFVPVPEREKELATVSRSTLLEIHKQLLSKHLNSIVVVSSLKPKQILKGMNQYLGDIETNAVDIPQAPTPKILKRYAFEHRDIPTAYIRLKIPMPGIKDQKQSAISNLMFKILDEELGLEIRTRRSLSYSAFSFIIDYTMGIGMIGVSTSKPQETLKALSEVISKLKANAYTSEELTEHKTVFTTRYFLSIENHSSLASTFSRHWLYFGTLDHHFNQPFEWDNITPKDIKTAAEAYLNDFTLSVIFDRKKFKDDWAKDFLSQHQEKKDAKQGA